MKYIFVSGGVVSGLGKGITAASIGLILEDKGVSVTNVKIDMYLNVDAGTIRPTEHGEVFVTDDGMETDQDLGNYERFTGKTLTRENYMTTGQVYKTVIDRERAFGYEGEDVEAIPHVTDEILKRLEMAGKKNKAKVVIVELGGTVGEYQNGIFFEASRILRLRQPKDVIHVHVTYLPYLQNIGELKSKPAQQSSHLLNAMGIQADFIVARSEKEIDEKRRDKLAVFCNLHKEDIISAPNLQSIYQVPLFMEDQDFGRKLLKKLRIGKRKLTGVLKGWKKFEILRQKTNKEISIAMVGKYFQTGDYKLTDSYISVIEAIKHAAWRYKVNPKLEWIDSEKMEDKEVDLSGFDAIIVPQGWGKRGVEGKLMAVKQAREKDIPYLGLCFGMQMAVIEFARNVLGLKDANSTEVNAKTKNPVIDIMPEQIEYLKKRQFGGTIRLGAWPCALDRQSMVWKLYDHFEKDFPSPWKKNNDFLDKGIIYERHRHRFEFNYKYMEKFMNAGMAFPGMSPDRKLVEVIQLQQNKFFVGTQYHPEYISRPLTPHPLFMGLMAAAID